LETGKRELVDLTDWEEKGTVPHKRGRAKPPGLNGTENLLGQALMKIRDQIRAEEAGAEKHKAYSW
jgi:predicted NAD-dependent protein-ADP-ribosyltransferase YbiA (DUF1768 family)